VGETDSRENPGWDRDETEADGEPAGSEEERERLVGMFAELFGPFPEGVADPLHHRSPFRHRLKRMAGRIRTHAAMERRPGIRAGKTKKEALLDLSCRIDELARELRDMEWSVKEALLAARDGLGPVERIRAGWGPAPWSGHLELVSLVPPGVPPELISDADLGAADPGEGEDSPPLWRRFEALGRLAEVAAARLPVDDGGSTSLVKRAHGSAKGQTVLEVARLILAYAGGTDPFKVPVKRLLPSTPHGRFHKFARAAYRYATGDKTEDLSLQFHVVEVAKLLKELMMTENRLYEMDKEIRERSRNILDTSETLPLWNRVKEIEEALRTVCSRRHPLRGGGCPLNVSS
jgi:hypothetical protein